MITTTGIYVYYLESIINFFFFFFPLILHTSSVPRNNIQLCVLSNEDGIGGGRVVRKECPLGALKCTQSVNC